QRQERGGAQSGSWPPDNDLYAMAGGRLMVTSLSLLTLQMCGRLAPPAADAPLTLKEGEAADAWADLAGSDYAKVRRAIERLAAAPAQAVPHLRERLQPAPAADAQRVARLIEELGSDDFDTREAAFRALQAQGEPAEPALRQALKGA